MASNEPASAPATHRDPLAVTPLAPGRWGAYLDLPDAALVAAVGVSAVVADTGEQDAMSATTHFVAAVTAGAVEISIGHIDRTPQHTTADASVRQHGRVVARLLVTSATARNDDRPPAGTAREWLTQFSSWPETGSAPTVRLERRGRAPQPGGDTVTGAARYTARALQAGMMAQILMGLARFLGAPVGLHLSPPDADARTQDRTTASR